MTQQFEQSAISTEALEARTLLSSVTVSVADAQATEGGDLEFAVSLSDVVDADTVISYSTADGTADGGDYGSVSGTLTIPAGQTSGTIVVSTTGDGTVELDETLSLTLTDIEASGRDVRFEGGEFATLAHHWTANGDATDSVGSSDGTLFNGTGFAQRQYGQAFSFDGVDDGVSTDLVVDYTNGVTFELWVQTTDSEGVLMAGGGGASTGFGMGLFLEPGGDLDLFGSKGVRRDLNFTLRGPSINDGQLHHVVATWTGDTTPDGIALYVDGEVVATGTAEAAITTDSSTMHFGKHSTIGYRTFAGLLDDIRIYESALSPTEVAALVSNEAAATGTILNDDSSIVSIADAQTVEGDDLEFGVSLSNPVDTDTVISFSTANGTADASDYTSVSSTLTIPAGQTAGTIVVSTTSDDTVELDETLSLTPTSLDASGRDVALERISIPPVSHWSAEGDVTDSAGGHDGNLVGGATFGEGIDGGQAFDFRNTGGYVSIPNAPELAPSEITVEAWVNLEPSTFQATLSYLISNGGHVPFNSLVGWSLGIAGNWNAPFPTVDGIRDTGKLFVFDGSGPSNGAGHVVWTETALTLETWNHIAFTNDGTTTSIYINGELAGSGPQTLPIPNGPLTFGRRGDGQAAMNGRIDEVQLYDRALTADEIQAGFQGTATASGTILNNDSATVSIDDATAVEGGDLEFDVTLSNPVDVDTVVTYSTSDGTATTGDGDYVSQSNQSITIAAGQTFGVITTATGDDDLVELDETLTVSINSVEASGRDVSVSSVDLSTGGTQSVFANVPEAADYVLVYDLAIPDRSNFDSGPVPYSVDNSGLIPDGSFDRIAYYLELDNGSGLQYAYVSADAFTQIAGQTGVPVITTGATFEQNLSSMNVFSNVPGIVTGSDISSGNIEFWHQNYGRTADDGLPGASDSIYDFDDQLSVGFDSGYGSMQIHNYDAGQTIFGFNAWDWSGGGDSDLGIGNSPRTREPDWTYAENAGTYNIKNLQVLVRLSDDNAVATGTIINDDYAPEADAGGPYVIDEGAGLTLDASATTDADSTALTYRWDVDGDGDYDENVTGVTPELSAAQMASLGLNDGPDSRAVTVEASDGTNIDTATTTLTINNVDPNFEAGANETLLPPVAGSFSRTLSFTDPGADFWTGTVNFGDDSGDHALTINQATKSFDLSHVFTADGIFTVTVTVEDDDAGSYTDTFDVTVILNTPPVANDDSISADEDNAVTFNVLSNDTDEQNNIFAGLTTALTSPSTGTLIDNGNGSFTYNPNGEFESLAVGESAQVSFDYRIEDSFGETDTATVTITIDGVNDAPIVTNASDVLVDEGQTAFNSGSWSDIDGSDIVSLSASLGTVTRNDDGTWSWSFEADDGPDESQTVVITADDGHGGVATTSFELTVNNAAPTVVSVSSTNADVENASSDGSVSVSGSFRDPGLDTHTVTVNWGDGTSEEVSVDQTADSFTGNHEYTSGGIFTVTVTVTDSDGAISTTETTSAVVEGAGVVDGTLFVIGTDGKDVIHVHEHWRHDRITVHAHLDIRQHGWWWHRRTTSTHVYQTFAAEDVDQIIVHALAGNDHVHVIGCFSGGITKDAVIFGGDGNDLLIGGRGNDVIVGGSGNDRIYGGHGRDILIGGTGRDKIDGGSHDDLLIAGAAANESDQASLDAALAAWIDGDLSAALLSLGTISDDATRDHLRGGRGTDELSGGARDKLKR